MTPGDIGSLNWEKGGGLLPVIVQDAVSGVVLMTAFVNREALAVTLEQRQLVLYSRSRNRLWTKGETSGNTIAVEKVVADCDRDALLVLGTPSGPACHTGDRSCFANAAPLVENLAFIHSLEKTITARIEAPSANSYTATLVSAGIHRLAQKVGEEGVEVALAANGSADILCSESADLLFHLLVLLRFRGLSLPDVVTALRHRADKLGTRRFAADSQGAVSDVRK
jgi:phosphoribosyl-ATP pyrophosphohydrolase/phosphoribosyl-AMP cyclohydrolase